MKAKSPHIADEHEEHDLLEDHENSDDIEKLRSVLLPEEKVFRLVTCMNDGSDGVLAATDRRVLFCDQQFISSDVVEFRYSEIAVVLSETELLTTKIALVGIDKALYVDGIDKEGGQRFLQYLETGIGQDFETSGSNGRHLKHVGELLNSDDITGSSVANDTDDLS